MSLLSSGGKLCGALRRPAWAVAALLLILPPGHAENRGQAEVAFQGYYLGGSAQHLTDISGLSLQFRNFLPGLGLLSGSFQGYGSEGRFRAGDNYLELRGAVWRGRRWTLTGGDFRFSSGLVDFPFYNISNPEISARGFKLEVSRAQTRYSFFLGNETLLAGPRVPFRIAAPQALIGASVQQRIGRLQWGARYLRLSSSPQSMEENPFFFPANRDFRSVNNFAVQALYSFTPRLHWYSEAVLSASEREETSDGETGGPFSILFGPAWEATRLSVRANYAYQKASYLPALGYFAGDRRGPFAEVRYRPFARLEVSGSASRYRNNLEQSAEIPTFQSTGYSAGVSLKLPWRFTSTTQLSWFHLLARTTEAESPRDSNNRQLVVTLARPVRRHNLRFSFRDLRLASVLRVEKQQSGEVEDVFQFRRFFLGAAVREQRSVSDQRRNTLFFRGSAQIALGRLTAYAQVESGTDLINRTVFATSNFQTTVFGVTARLTRDWSLQAEAFRNRMISELNPESIFVLENRGVGLSSAIAGFNQWSMFFRVTKQIHWGGPLPREGLEQYAAEQIPLVGSVEGFVYERAAASARPANAIPVSLDGSRTVSTDVSGSFRFSQVPEGAHRVSLATRELPAEFDPGPSAETVVQVHPQRTVRVELDVIPLGSLEGQVTGPPGSPLGNILIHLLPIGRYTTPDTDGRFWFYNLREGDYEVVLDERTLPEHSVLLTPARMSLSFRVGLKPTPLRFEFEVRPPEKPIRRVIEQQIRIGEPGKGPVPNN